MILICTIQLAGPVDGIQKTEVIENQRPGKMTIGPKIQKTIRPKK